MDQNTRGPWRIVRLDVGATVICSVGNGIDVALVERFVGHRVFVDGVMLHLDDASVPVPGPSNAPGMCLWEAQWNMWLPEHRPIAVDHQPRLFDFQFVEHMIAGLFRRVEVGEIIVAGKEAPARPASPYVPLTPADRQLWRFDLVSNEARPRLAGTAVSFTALRVFTQEEWEIIRGPAAGGADQSPSNMRANKGGAPPDYPWDEFAQEVVRHAWEDDLRTRRGLRKHMENWVAQNWRQQPSASLMRDRIRRLCPANLPEV